ncbi:MAG: hypothetical protein MJ000_06945 [Bacteroidales bacterium]|nr:hypothetical protein [Bacteroidales bacterium]
MAENAVNANMFLNFDLIVGDFYHDSSPFYTSYHISYCFDKRNPRLYVCSSEKDLIYNVGRKEVVFASVFNRDYFRSYKIFSMENSYFSGRNDAEWKFEFMPYYTYVLPYTMQCRQCDQDFHCRQDTVINGKLSIKFISKTQKRMMNDSTGRYTIPVQYECTTWINGETFHVDSVVAVNISNKLSSFKTVYTLSNINNDDESNYYNSIFNPGNDDISKARPVNSSRDFSDTCNIKLKLIGVEYDTLCVADQDSWILLDLWMFGCGPCEYAFKQLKHEYDSLNHFIIEESGIKLLAANPKSNNMEAIKETSEEHGNVIPFYTANVVSNNVFLVNGVFPSYFLISPEKKIVYRSNDLGDYSELLKAKADYEASFKN